MSCLLFKDYTDYTNYKIVLMKVNRNGTANSLTQLISTPLSAFLPGSNSSTFWMDVMGLGVG